MRVSVIGTGYVGLVTGVCLSEIGHTVTCIDIDPRKIEKLSEGQSPIYEPGLEEMIQRNLSDFRVHFSTSFETVSDSDIVLVAVGTPSLPTGFADLSYIESAFTDIAKHLKDSGVVAIKSTVPVGTCARMSDLIYEVSGKRHEVLSNPEFLREGSALNDTFHADRIIIGAEDTGLGDKLQELYAGFEVPVIRTDVRSAELTKYASNAFLATKISFINEIANLATRFGANISDITLGMSMDKRIGGQFLQAGIGYGGSCFPKDTNALVQIAGDVEHDFKLLKAVIEVNNQQQLLPTDILFEKIHDVRGAKIAVLGAAFKPNTDDVRFAPSLAVTRRLVDAGANVYLFDPVVGAEQASEYPHGIQFTSSIEEALARASAALILTEWQVIQQVDWNQSKSIMARPLVIDGRNCYPLDEAKEWGIEYYSVGRQPICQLSPQEVSGY